MLARFALALLLALGLSACGSTPPEAGMNADAVRAGVMQTLDTQVAAWNEGSIRGFMDGYARTDTLMFLSGGSMRRGWEESFYAYKRGYPDRSAMGTLSFEEIEVRPLSATHALAFGRWRLTRGEDAPTGLFSLLLQNTDEGWLVVHDHTSSE